LFSSALIGLREGLEAGLVISILVAFLVKTDDRAALKWVWTGVSAAVLLSVVFGAVIHFTQEAFDFKEREILGGSLSILAVALVTGMIFWMRGAGKTIAAELRGKLSDALRMGPLAVVVLSLLAVGREGLETTVFFYATVEAAGGGTTEPLLGFIIGIAAAIVLSWLLYRGAVRINLKRFFTVTGVLLVFVAAGVLGYGLHDLQEGDVLPGLHDLAFDLSTVLPEDSWYGATLKGIFNYSQQTTWIQAVAWLSYVAIVLTAFLWPAKKPAVMQVEEKTA
jgi:high-affinity iron transporter